MEKEIKKKALAKKKITKKIVKRAVKEKVPNTQCCGACQYRYLDEYEEGGKKCRRYPSHNYSAETRVIHNDSGGFDHREITPIHPYIEDFWPACGEYKKIQLTGVEK